MCPRHLGAEESQQVRAILPEEAARGAPYPTTRRAAPLERSSRRVADLRGEHLTELAGTPLHLGANDTGLLVMSPAGGVTRIGLSPLLRPNDALQTELRRRTTACPDLEQGRAGVFKRRGGSPFRPRRAICRDVAERPGPLDNGPGSDRPASWSARPARRCEPGRVAKWAPSKHPRI